MARRLQKSRRVATPNSAEAAEPAAGKATEFYADIRQSQVSL